MREGLHAKIEGNHCDSAHRRGVRTSPTTSRPSRLARDVCLLPLVFFPCSRELRLNAIHPEQK